MKQFLERIYSFVTTHSVLSLLLLISINQYFWISVIPFNFAPDEYAHFDVVKRLLIGSYFSPVTANDQFIITAYGQQGVSYAILQPIPYIIGAFFALFSPSDNHQFLFARFGSLGAVLFIVIAVYQLFLIFTKNKTVALFGSGFIGFYPQISFLGSYVNSDIWSLALPWLALTYATKIYLQQKTTVLQVVIFSLSSGLSLLTRYNSYPLIAISVLLFLFGMINTPKRSKLLAISAGIIITLSSWWYIHTFLLFGEPFGVGTFYSLLKRVRPQEFRNLGIYSLVFSTDWVWVSFKSFFASFDWNYIFLPNWIYLLVFFLIFLGLLFFLQTVLSASKRMKILFFLYFLAIVITLFLSMYHSAYASYQPQGRHVLIILAPVYAMINFGYFSKYFGSALLKIFALLIFLINHYCLLFILVPRYYAQNAAFSTLWKQAFYEIYFQKPFPFVKVFALILVSIQAGLFFLCLKKISLGKRADERI